MSINPSAGAQLLPYVLAMQEDVPQRMPYPEGTDGVTGVYGELTNGQRIAFHLKVEVREGVHAQSGALLRSGALMPALRELIIVRVGYQTGCHYEVGQHGTLAERLGVPHHKCAALAYVAPQGLSDDEAAVIAFVDELLYKQRPSDVALDRVRARFSDGEILEMVFVVGNWWTLSRMLETAGIPIDTRKIGEHGVAPVFAPSV